MGTELWGSHYEGLLHIVKSYIIDIWELCKSKLYGSGTGPLQHISRPWRDIVCHGRVKFGKLGGRMSCSIVYGSNRVVLRVQGPWPKCYSYHLNMFYYLVAT